MSERSALYPRQELGGDPPCDVDPARREDFQPLVRCLGPGGTGSTQGG